MAEKDPYVGTPYEGMKSYEKAIERMKGDPYGEIIAESEKKSLIGTQKWADDRIKILRKLQATEKADLKGKENYEQKLRDITQKHRQEALNLDAENDRKAWEYKLNNARDYTNRLDTVFKDFYVARGKQDKTLFLLSKAAAIATIIIKTSQGIMLALGENNWPLALLITAEGAAQMATVSAQTLARGGLVQGYSPTKTADNIPLAGTAGEFMQPVDSVNYYGTRVHEAMRQKLIPRELFSGLTLPGAPGASENLSPSPSGRNLQAGGPVGDARENIPADESAKDLERPAFSENLPAEASAKDLERPAFSENLSAGGLTEGTQKSEFTFVNITDPRELDRYLATPAGKDAVINVLSSRLQTVRRIIR